MNNINQKHLIIGVIVIIIMIVVIIAYILSERNEYTNYEQLEITEESSTEETKTEEEGKIKVHIAGSVVTEGVVELPEGARIDDAIKAAGGTTADANMQKINLAYKLQDGQKIYIPNLNEDETTIVENLGIIEESQSTSNITNTSGKVNINTAKQTELELLTGIGPSTATAIIQYREENGKFNAIEDIKNVPGIGDAKYENIKEQITV